MKIEAYNEMDAQLKIKQVLGYNKEQYKLIKIKDPVFKLWGLVKKKGEYRILMKAFKENSKEAAYTQEQVNGYVAITNGKAKVVNPVKNGRYPFIIADDQNINVYVNGTIVKGCAVVTEQDKIVLKPKIVKPITDISVEISEDKMEAYLKIEKKKGRRYYVKDVKKGIFAKVCSDFEYIDPPDATFEECLKAIRDSGINMKLINIDNIKQLILSPTGGSMVVAKGQYPINGVKTQINYYFPLGGEEDSFSQDYKIAQIGDVIAEKIMLAVPGRDGYTVTGELIKAVEEDDESLDVSEGAILLESGTKAVASRSGRPALINGKICVIPLMIVPGDVNKDTGDIDFDGEIIIRGNVLDNCKVVAGGRIKIIGNVYNSKVVSNEDIYIEGKVIGGNVTAGMNMTNYYCIMPLIEKVTTIVEEIISQIEAVKEDDMRLAPHTVYTSKNMIRDCIKEIKKLLPMVDDKQYLTNIMQKVKDSVSMIDMLHMKDTGRLREVHRKLTQYIDEIKERHGKNAKIVFQYAQKATIQSCGSIIVTGEGSYQSTLLAKDEILCRSPFSQVLGGILIAGRKISAGKIGSDAGVKTYCRLTDKDGKIYAHIYGDTTINMNGKMYVITDANRSKVLKTIG